MEISHQIKKNRTAMKLSQEQLAERIFVSRQTISNWENGKSYPDLQSILLLGSVFDITLDQLIKGDLEEMKKEINLEEVRDFNKLSKLFAAALIAVLIAFIPLTVFFKLYGILVWAILYTAVMVLAVHVEREKKKYDLSTYREIVAFSEGKSLDEIEKQREIGKRPYQTALKVLAGLAAGLIIAAAAIFLMKCIG